MSDTLTSIATAVTPLDLDDVDGLEVCNVDIGDTAEAFELGPFAGNRYLRIRGTDLIAVAAQLRRLADDLTTHTFDERDARMPRCQCGARIQPDETTCGARRCDYLEAGGF